MTTAVLEAVDSLSTRQINVLLQTLKRHFELLEASHQDAMRKLERGVSACYLVDYELLFRYMFEVETKPERVLELEYLFQQGDIAFILGVGTQVELISDISRRTGLDVTIPGISESESLDHYLAGLQANAREKLTESLAAATARNRRDAVGFERLRDLLQQRNVINTSTVSNLRLNSETFARCRNVLNAIRPQHTRNNVADAFNITQVLALRTSDIALYPFTLTESRHLLGRDFGETVAEDAYKASDQVPEVWQEVSRTPLTAIYSVTARRCYSSPIETARDTAGLSLAAASLQADLRRAHGYVNNIEDRPDGEWQSMVRTGRIGPGSLDQLNKLTDFINEPIIAETQRLYDNIQQSAANYVTQRKRLSTAYSPRRLFDLISGLSRSLEAKRSGTSAFEDTWQLALDLQLSRTDGVATYSLWDSGAAKDILTAYLEVEAHSNYFVYRWSTDSDIERILSAFCSAYARHQVDEVVVQVGTGQNGVLEFDAVLPITLGEIIEACDSPAMWIRMEAPNFDLYADLVSEPDVDPVIGLVVDQGEPEHIADLFSATSSRFLFSAWLVPALQSIQERSDATRHEPAEKVRT